MFSWDFKCLEALGFLLSIFKIQIFFFSLETDDKNMSNEEIIKINKLIENYLIE